MSLLEYIVPIVLGSISENNNTPNVNIADATPIIMSKSELSAYNFATSVPTPNAPTVCAMVFNVSMAVRGLSGSFLNFLQSLELYPK